MIDQATDALGNVAGQLAGASPGLVAVALVFHLANHVLRSVAWRSVLAAAYPDRRVGLLPVLSAYAMGVALNAVLPGRGGDAAKVALVRTRVPGSSVATIAATMTVVVLFDLVAATVLVGLAALGGAVPLAPGVPWGGVGTALHDHGLVIAVGAVAFGVVAVLTARRLRGPLRLLVDRARQGGAILTTPARYARQVVAPQALAWACRIMVVFFLLRAFGLATSIPLAAVVMVLCGASTLVPLTPGGAGTQQVLVTYVLGQAASATIVLSFSVGMQAGTTAVNGLLGVAGAMVAFRTVRPWTAVRAGLRLARGPAAG